MAIPTWQLAGLGGWLISILASGSIANAKALSETITVDLMHGPITEFLPDEVFGGALDGHEAGEVKQIYSTENMQRMLGAGLRKSPTGCERSSGSKLGTGVRRDRGATPT